MAELTYFYGTMNCGKSTLALQIHHNAVTAGKHCLLFTKHDRGGGRITSRIGLEQDAIVVTDAVDIAAYVSSATSGGAPVDVVICDETQFFTAAQIEQLAWLVDELEVEVQAFGLLTDFTTHLFAGSQRLLELADRRQELQVEARCWCGERGTHNARTVDGAIQRQGQQVVVGDLPQASLETGEVPAVAYEVLCRRHHRQGITRAEADRQPERERGRTNVPVAGSPARG